MKINIKPSSNVVAVEYDEESKVVTITFKGGSRYEYYGVPKDTVLGLELAESTGKYIGANIKGKYPFKKLEN